MLFKPFPGFVLVIIVFLIYPCVCVPPSQGEDEAVVRQCYEGVERDGEVIRVRDTVLLRSGPRKKSLPYVAKISALWEDPKTGKPNCGFSAWTHGWRDVWKEGRLAFLPVCLPQESWWWAFFGTTDLSTLREAEIPAHTVRWGLNGLQLRINFSQWVNGSCAVFRNSTLNSLWVWQKHIQTLSYDINLTRCCRTRRCAKITYKEEVY